MKDFTYSGVWWLPGRENVRVAGSLSFTVGTGLKLSLLGALQATSNPFEDVEHPLVLGVTQEGKAVTLYHCVQTNFNLSFNRSSPGFTSQTLNIEVAYIGAHFLDIGDLRFYKAEVKYNHLPEWVGVSGFHEEFQPSEESEALLKVTYSHPSVVSFTTSFGVVSFQHTLHTSNNRPMGISLTQDAYALMQLNAEMGLDQLWIAIISPLQNLLSLATGEPNITAQVIMYSRTSALAKQGRDAAEYPIEAVFASYFPELDNDEPIARGQMLFSLMEIVHNPDILATWLAVGSELDSVCNLFFSVQYHPRMYLEQRFLNMVQAAETYHRRRRNNHVLPKLEHRARIRRIVSAAPEAERAWLQEQLAYGNEPRLRDRLTDLITLTEPVMLPLVGDAHTFARSVTNTRNYLTHYDQRLKDKHASGEELYRLTQKLSVLVRACLLNDLGVTPTQAATMFQRNEEYRHLVSLEPMATPAPSEGVEKGDENPSQPEPVIEVADIPMAEVDADVSDNNPERQAQMILDSGSDDKS